MVKTSETQKEAEYLTRLKPYRRYTFTLRRDEDREAIDEIKLAVESGLTLRAYVIDLIKKSKLLEQSQSPSLSGVQGFFEEYAPVF